MESGILVEWLKKPGDPVRRGDVVAVVETQKGAIEVEIFVDGVMGQPLVPLGAKVPVGTPLAIIEAGGPAPATVPRVAPPPAPVVTTIAPSPPATVTAAPVTSLIPGARVSPAARKAARERGIDIALIRGSGPGGAITIGDIDRAATTPSVRLGLDLDKMRSAIAAAMAHSKREIPHYYLTSEIDMARTEQWLESANASRTPERRLLSAVLMLKAVGLALRKHAAFNGTYSASSGFQPSEHVHVGAAIAIRGGGLASPALHDCDAQDLDTLMNNFRDLVSRARVGRLRSSELSDATITVSNLGDRGVESVFGIIYPPQVAMLGFGKTLRKPVVIDGSVQVRPIVVATLAADHRVTDGHAGSLFLNEIANLLNQPERL